MFSITSEAWLLPGHLILPLSVEKSKSQSPWPVCSLLPRLLEKDWATWQVKIYIQPLVLQSGAFTAHRQLLSSYNKAIRASGWALSALHPNQGGQGCCVCHTAVQLCNLDAVQKVRPAAGERHARGIPSFAPNGIARQAVQQKHFAACWVHHHWGMINEGPAAMGQARGSDGHKTTPMVPRTLQKTARQPGLLNYHLQKGNNTAATWGKAWAEATAQGEKKRPGWMVQQRGSTVPSSCTGSITAAPLPNPSLEIRTEPEQYFNQYSITLGKKYAFKANSDWEGHRS